METNNPNFRVTVDKFEKLQLTITRTIKVISFPLFVKKAGSLWNKYNNNGLNIKGYFLKTITI